MKKVLANTKSIFKKLLYSKSFYIVFGSFLVVFAFSLVLISYSYYYSQNSNEIIRGKVVLNNSDITLKVYIQQRDSDTGDPLTDGDEEPLYEQVYFIPKSDYTYASSSCSTGLSISSMTADYKFTITADRKGVCEVYFTANDTDAVKGNANAKFNLFVQQEVNGDDYVQVGEIPTKNNYSVNTSKTTSACSAATVDNTNHVINLTLSGDATCDIYLDIDNSSS